MNIRPSGRLVNTPNGQDLVLTRTYRASAEDVWASITEPDRTARWFGPWKGEAGPGRTIQVQLTYEEEQPWTDFIIDACIPPRHLCLRTVDDQGSWQLEATLSEHDGQTELVFTHHLTSPELAGEAGPGWEYYLDMLGAARTGADLPDFADYYPAMRDFYVNATPD
ncbi:SRPBCC family protein [Nocardia flavorosea]|uniref:SRPBCC family protein n=1 Tax=Nocardia flavorosea TaxID=53429 RepID=UPI001894CB1E|nr:SRPBCC family protein [Nocardia flavorosea]MBF6348656.1 SRPBCC family protein [Nocardia flavorosea]